MEKILICFVMLLFVGAKPIPEKPLSVQWNLKMHEMQGVDLLKNDLAELDSLCGQLEK